MSYLLCASLVYCVLQEGLTPLMFAAQKNKTAAIEILINEGKCDRDATTNVSNMCCM